MIGSSVFQTDLWKWRRRQQFDSELVVSGELCPHLAWQQSGTREHRMGGGLGTARLIFEAWWAPTPNFSQMCTTDIGDGLLYSMFHNDYYKVNQYFDVKSWCFDLSVLIFIITATAHNWTICNLGFSLKHFHSSMACTIFFSLYSKAPPVSMQARAPRRTLLHIPLTPPPPPLLIQGVLYSSKVTISSSKMAERFFRSSARHN